MRAARKQLWTCRPVIARCLARPVHLEYASEHSLGRPIGAMDGFIVAATAEAHGLTLVTRDASDFKVAPRKPFWPPSKRWHCGTGLRRNRWPSIRRRGGQLGPPELAGQEHAGGRRPPTLSKQAPFRPSSRHSAMGSRLTASFIRGLVGGTRCPARRDKYHQDLVWPLSRPEFMRRNEGSMLRQTVMSQQ
jgi:hypothetical protein